MTNLEKRTILLNAVYGFGSNLVANFISVYLYIYTGSIPMMCLYIICRIGMFPIFFSLGNKISKKYPFAVTYLIGLILIICALTFALFGGPLFDANPYYVLIAAIIIGCGEGFYWFSANNMNQIVSSIDTRAQFYSYNGVFTNIACLLGPIFASFMLSINHTEIEAYKMILVTIIIVFIFVTGIAFSLNKRSEDSGKSNLLNALSLKDPIWRDHTLGMLMYGLRNGLELNTISLLVYEAAKGGDTYSKLQIVFSAIMIFAYRVIAKKLNRDKIEITFKIGVLFKISSIMALIILPNTIGAIIYGTINALATVFYDNSYNILSANIISKYPGETTVRVVAREIFLSISRCIAMLFVLLCYKLLPSTIYIQVAVMTLSMSTILVQKIFCKYK